mgnify:CR=1 FL=1|jgi:hypothetical protein
MKKIMILMMAAMMPVIAGAQAQIDTKKVKIADFPEKVTKIVLTGSDFFDLALQDDVAATWRVSPYEFCTIEEFEALKADENFYFLITTNDQFRREDSPGIQFMSLVKGGKGAEKGISEMFEVVSMPVASAEDPSGREYTFLSAFLDIIQKHVLMSIESDITGYAGLTNHTDNIQDCKGMRIVFSEDDLSGQVDRNLFDEDMVITDEDEADEIMSDREAETLVSLVVAPSSGKNGSYCFKMLVNAETHELFYFRRHKITKKDAVGFLAEDIRKIMSHR